MVCAAAETNSFSYWDSAGSEKVGLILWGGARTYVITYLGRRNCLSGQLITWAFFRPCDSARTFRQNEKRKKERKKEKKKKKKKKGKKEKEKEKNTPTLPNLDLLCNDGQTECASRRGRSIGSRAIEIQCSLFPESR